MFLHLFFPNFSFLEAEAIRLPNAMNIQSTLGITSGLATAENLIESNHESGPSQKSGLLNSQKKSCLFQRAKATILPESQKLPTLTLFFFESTEASFILPDRYSSSPSLVFLFILLSSCVSG